MLAKPASPAAYRLPSIQYKRVEGFPYLIGSDGSVWSFHGGKKRQMKITYEKRFGYGVVTLVGNGKRRWVHVHTLVLEAFVGPCPEGYVACHFPDRNGSNNSLANLQWGTPQLNQEHRLIHGTHGRGERSPTAKLSRKEAERLRRYWKSGNWTQPELQELFDLSKSGVQHIIYGTSHNYVG